MVEGKGLTIFSTAQGDLLRQRETTVVPFRQPSSCSDAVSHLQNNTHPTSGAQSWKLHTSNSRFRTPNLVTILFCFILWISASSAVALDPTNRSILLFDTRPPPEPPMRLIRRAVKDESSSSSSSSTKTKSATKTSSASSSSSSTSKTTTAAFTLPSAFDTSLGNNFTAPSCPKFFNKFLSNDTFNDCVPLSLLLQTSVSFFSVQKSSLELSQTLEASCNVNFTTCSTLMASYAREIQLDKNCGADLALQNPMVVQAYDGFVAYQPLYTAGCLMGSSGNYCFSDAVTNTSSPTSSYVYYLPLGVSLPSTTKPDCSTCLQNTMAVFASAAINSSQPVAKVYAAAATLIDESCGADFVNASVVTGGVDRVRAAGGGFGGLGTLALVFAVAFGFC